MGQGAAKAHRQPHTEHKQKMQQALQLGMGYSHPMFPLSCAWGKIHSCTQNDHINHDLYGILPSSTQNTYCAVEEKQLEGTLIISAIKNHIFLS